jgi:transposase
MIAAVVERCAGIDVGKKFLKVCVMVGPLSEEPRFEIRKIDCCESGYQQLHKTDACDAWWLAHLLRHGMIRPSFIPEKATRELRELTRRRKKLIGLVAQERNRVQKHLEYGNVKLGNELSDVFGLSGQLMLHARVDKKCTPEQIAELAQGV